MVEQPIEEQTDQQWSDTQGQDPAFETTNERDNK